MTFTFNDNDRQKLSPRVSLSIDPAAATIALLVDGVEHPCSWTGDAVRTGSDTLTDPYVWTRGAVTNAYLAGPAVPSVDVDGATVLAYGTHTLEAVVSAGSVIKAVVLPPFNISR